MDHRKHHSDVNEFQRKRRSDSNNQRHPPTKKLKQDNGAFQRSHISVADAVLLPDPMPDLPPVIPKYEKIVFTHPSAAQPGSRDGQSENYDRLEFLGDAYIEIIASKLIFENYPQTQAGAMCRLRESVVKNETLSRYSLHYGFDKKLRYSSMDQGSSKSWTKIYGDVFEAYAAAIVLSDPKGGQTTLETWLKALWSPILREVEVKLPDPKVNYKDQLAKSVGCPNVKLEYVEERKPIIHVGSGRETYFIGVYLEGWGYKNQHIGSGEGHSKTIAGNEAASNAMNNHPFIDELIAKKKTYLEQRALAKQEKEGAFQSNAKDEEKSV